MVDEHPAGSAVCRGIHEALLGPSHKEKSLLICPCPSGIKYIFFQNEWTEARIDSICTSMRFLVNDSSVALGKPAVILAFL